VIAKHAEDQQDEGDIKTLEQNIYAMREQLEIAKGNYEKKQLNEIDQRER
jgi:hypothetical protein